MTTKSGKLLKEHRVNEIDADGNEIFVVKNVFDLIIKVKSGEELTFEEKEDYIKYLETTVSLLKGERDMLCKAIDEGEIK